MSHKDCSFFSVKHNSQVTLFKSDTTVASSVLSLSGLSSYPGQCRFGVDPQPANTLSQARKVSLGHALCQLGCCASRNETGKKADRTVPGSGGVGRKVRGPGRLAKIEVSGVL